MVQYVIAKCCLLAKGYWKFCIITRYNFLDLNINTRITNRPYWPPIDQPLTSNGSGTDNTSNDHHLVYPNPSSDQVNINGLTRGSSLIVVDALGRVVYTTRDMKTNNLTISIADWQDGIYYLRESCINGHVKTSVLCKI